MSKLLVEAEAKRVMTAQEVLLKKQLIALLKDDGEGHHHAAYARRLAPFEVNIVYNDPEFTASISFDDGIIRISNGFLAQRPTEQQLKDKKFPTLFKQLNVLIRHELLHNLLMHQIRMEQKFMKEFGEEGAKRLSLSRTLGNLENIIMDDEISHRRYTEADKKTIREMWLNGRIIGGLVTEDHRPSWVNLSIEEMYEKLGEEMDEIQNAIKNDPDYHTNQKDFVARELRSAIDIYSDMTTPSIMRMPFAQFKNSGLFKHFPEHIQKLMTDVDNEFSKSEYSANDINNIMETIAYSAATKPTSLINKDGEVIATVYTPEEKALIMEELKMLAGISDYVDLYKKWFDKVQQVLADPKYSDDDLETILKEIDK